MKVSPRLESADCATVATGGLKLWTFSTGSYGREAFRDIAEKGKR